MQKPTILITGVAGFIGSHLAECLLKSGYSVIGIDNLSNGFLRNLVDILQNPRFTFIQKDFEKVNVKKEVSLGGIYHLASVKIPRDEKDSGFKTISSAAKGLEWITAVWKKHKCKLIFASTSEVYGPLSKLPFIENEAVSIGSPTDKRWVYAASKLHSEHYFAAFGREFGLDYTIARLFSVYGKRQHPSWMGGVQSAFIENIKAGKPIEIHGRGEQKRVFTYIDDAIRALVLMLETQKSTNQIFNIQGPAESEISVNDLAQKIIALFRKLPNEYPIRHIPQFYANGEDDIQAKSANTEKALNLLGWQANTGLDDGLKRIISAK